MSVKCHVPSVMCQVSGVTYESDNLLSRIIMGDFMPLIKCFEDIQAWQEARVLTRQIYKLTRSGGFARDFGLREWRNHDSRSIA